MSNEHGSALSAVTDKLESLTHLMQVLQMACEAIEDTAQKNAIVSLALYTERGLMEARADVGALGPTFAVADAAVVARPASTVKTEDVPTACLSGK